MNYPTHFIANSLTYLHYWLDLTHIPCMSKQLFDVTGYEVEELKRFEIRVSEHRTFRMSS
jgi:hypothetical protein